MRVLKVGRRKIRQYGVQDIMDKLQISKVTALKLINSGQLKSIRIGRRHWINEEDLIAFLLDKKNKRLSSSKRNSLKKKENPIIRFVKNLFLR